MTLGSSHLGARDGNGCPLTYILLRNLRFGRARYAVRHKLDLGPTKTFSCSRRVRYSLCSDRDLLLQNFSSEQ
ncbi:hypothetical protein MPLB_1490002 [Mesorhizobium sp. ORS 3324]|nr:hypothetical protein MPLB_1490002 [Mesorhizobium sp. ORS 3324]